MKKREELQPKREYFNVYEFEKIIKIVRTDPFQARKKFEEYLEKYPLDYYANLSYISLLMRIQEFDLAEDLLYEIEKKMKKETNVIYNDTRRKGNESLIFYEKLKLACYRDNYEEAIRIINDNPNFFEEYDLANVLIYCESKLGKKAKRSPNKYIIRQMIEYKEDDMKEHIKRHLADENINQERQNQNLFVPNFPIDTVIEEIKKYIPSSEKICPGIYHDEYIFKFDNCGRHNWLPTDYFLVVTFSNTPDIITMCPVGKRNNLPYVDLNYLNDSKKDTPKVKVMSQIEKFKNRYNY